MVNPVIVSLSKYPDLFNGMNENINRFAGQYDRILVRDGKIIERAPGWKLIDGPDQFNFSKNVNTGWREVDPTADIFFTSDDVRLTSPNTIETLQNLAYRDPSIGMIAPRVIGTADNYLQTNPPQTEDIVYSSRYLVFVCLYIKRAVIDKIGYMDGETFSGYGWDDVDYSRRVKNGGFKLAVTPRVEIIHGTPQSKCTETFMRVVNRDENILGAQNRRNEALYVMKWGDSNKG
jgi:GT2 family glycosyltransferase